MVRGRRQNPDAPPSRQLEISRAFRQRKASDLKDLRDRADRLERENIELRQECERLRQIVRRSSFAVSSTDSSNSQSSHLQPSAERLYQNEVVHRIDNRTEAPQPGYRRGDDLMANFDQNWPSVQVELDRYSHAENSMTNTQQHMNGSQQPITDASGSTNMPPQQVYGFEGNGTSQQQINTPVLRLANEMQTFDSSQLRNESQMRGIGQMMDRGMHSNPVSDPHHLLTPSTLPTTSSPTSPHQHNSRHPNPDQHDQDPSQRLWEFAVPRTQGLDESKCCGGIFECDESGHIKVETPPHIAYPA